MALLYCRTRCGDVCNGKPALVAPGKNQVLRRKQDGLADLVAGRSFLDGERLIVTGIIMVFDCMAAQGKFQYFYRCGVPGVDFNRVNTVPLFYRVDTEQSLEFKFTGKHVPYTTPLLVFGIVQFHWTYAAAITEFSGMEFG